MPSRPSRRTRSSGWDSGLSQCVAQQTLAAFRPVSSRARTTSSWFMWLIGSTPSKPAALTARSFSMTEPGKPMVAYMMALCRLRLRAGSAAAAVPSAAAAATAPPCLRKSRRFRPCRMVVVLGARDVGRAGAERSVRIFLLFAIGASCGCGVGWRGFANASISRPQSRSAPMPLLFTRRRLVSALARNRFRPLLETLEDRTVPATPVTGRIFTVNSTLDTDTTYATLTLRQALNVVDGTPTTLSPAEMAQIQPNTANPSVDLIQFDPKLFKGGPGTLTVSPVMNNPLPAVSDASNSLVINGPGANLLTVKYAGFNPAFTSVFDVSGSQPVTISGLTVSGGGTGITNFASAPLTVDAVEVTGNGGFSSQQGVDQNPNGNFINVGPPQGGVNNQSGSTLILLNSTLDHNQGTSGAGLLNNGTATVINCTIADNTATGDGG